MTYNYVKETIKTYFKTTQIPIQKHCYDEFLDLQKAKYFSFQFIIQ